MGGEKDESKKKEEKEGKMEVKGEKKETRISNIISQIKSKFKKEDGERPPEMEKLGSEDKHSSVFEVLKPGHEYKGEIEISFNKITFGKITIQIVKAE